MRRLDELIRASQQIVSGELALPAVLHRIVQAACDLVGARYGALGVLGPGRGLEQFSIVGLTDEEIVAIGALPHGRGILGALIEDPEPLRLDDIAADPRHFGFPDRHPPMKTFLGVPIRVHGEVFGNLYLSERRSGTPFTDEDEELLTALAAAAGTAIENARLLAQARRGEAWMAAAAEITRHILSSPAGEPLQLIAAAARDVADADLVTIVAPVDGSPDMLQVEIATGLESEVSLVGSRIVAGQSVVGRVIATGRPRLIDDIGQEPDVSGVINPFQLGPSMFLPLLGEEHVLGALCLGRRRGRDTFTPVDMDMAAMFANQAALAFELAQARADRDRLALIDERFRIARDLHDHVVQQLFAAELTLQGSAMVADSELTRRISQAVDAIDDAIFRIRGSIFELRNSGATSALRARLRRVVDEIEPALGFRPELNIAGPIDDIAAAIADDVVACVRDALGNVARHAQATQVIASIEIGDGSVSVQVVDDGVGYPESDRTSGLADLRNRARARGGSCTLDSRVGGGTEVHWRVPTSRPPTSRT